MKRTQKLHYLLYASAPLIIQRFIDALQPADSFDSEGQCLFETFKWVATPITLKLQEDSLTNDFLLLTNAFLIDALIVYVSAMFVLRGNKSIMFGIILFYVIRGVSVTFGGKWPQPEPYMFNYPGFPSLFVPYDQTNDFYFSGHTGLLTGLLMDSMHHGYFKLSLVNFLGTLYTIFVLLVTGGHFLNDIIMGFVASTVCLRLAIRYKYSLSYWLMKGICCSLESFRRTTELASSINEKLARRYLENIKKWQKLNGN